MHSSKRAQGSPEFILVASMVAMVFLVIMIITFQKQDEAFNTQVYLSAKGVAKRLADNINTIAKNGHGYYNNFDVPRYLHGYTPYNVTIIDNFLSISYGEENWEIPLTTTNVTIINLNKGPSGNCIRNIESSIYINETCPPWSYQ
jgi:uncharacterized protein (UPF0333 family)